MTFLNLCVAFCRPSVNFPFMSPWVSMVSHQLHFRNGHGPPPSLQLKRWRRSKRCWGDTLHGFPWVYPKSWLICWNLLQWNWGYPHDFGKPSSKARWYLKRNLAEVKKTFDKQDSIKTQDQGTSWGFLSPGGSQGCFYPKSWSKFGFGGGSPMTYRKPLK